MIYLRDKSELVWERERETEREGWREGERERELNLST